MILAQQGDKAGSEAVLGLFHVIIPQTFSTDAGQELHANTTSGHKRKAVDSLSSDEDMAKSCRKRKAVGYHPSRGEKRESCRKR